MTQLYILETDQIKEGSVIVPDAGFTCMKAGTKKRVKSDNGRLYVSCSYGKHYLDGQVDFEDETKTVGFLFAEAQ